MDFIWLITVACIVVLLALPVWIKFPIITAVGGFLLVIVGVSVMAAYGFAFPNPAKVGNEAYSLQYFYGVACAFGGMALLAPSTLMLAVRQYKRRLDQARAQDAVGETPDLPPL